MLGGTNTSSNRGIISNQQLGTYIEFQYNPVDITDSMPDNWKKTIIQGGAAPLLSFQVRDLPTKSFELLLDAHASPHPNGHIAQDIDDLLMLTVPYDEDAKPLIFPSLRMPPKAKTTSKKVVGIPPLVKIAYGGRVQRGIITNLRVKEELHGTTPESKDNVFPTRAHVTFELAIIDDMRMLVYFEANKT